MIQSSTAAHLFCECSIAEKLSEVLSLGMFPKRDGPAPGVSHCRRSFLHKEAAMAEMQKRTKSREELIRVQVHIHGIHLGL